MDYLSHFLLGREGKLCLIAVWTVSHFSAGSESRVLNCSQARQAGLFRGVVSGAARTALYITFHFPLKWPQDRNELSLNSYHPVAKKKKKAYMYMYIFLNLLLLVHACWSVFCSKFPPSGVIIVNSISSIR